MYECGFEGTYQIDVKTTKIKSKPYFSTTWFVPFLLRKTTEIESKPYFYTTWFVPFLLRKTTEIESKPYFYVKPANGRAIGQANRRGPRGKGAGGRTGGRRDG